MTRLTIQVSTVAILISHLFWLGCGRQSPVSVISIEDSGVTVTEPEALLTEGDWGGWRGPTGDGIAREQELVIRWDEQSNVIWRADIPGSGHNSPIVVGQSVFLASAVEESQEQMVLAYQFSDGVEMWRTVVHRGGFPSPGEMHQKSTNANGTIASDGSRLYTAMFNSNAIMVTALNLRGEKLWQTEIGSFTSRHGYAPSPVVYKSLVIVAADTGGGGYIAALDGASGKIAWRVSRPLAYSFASPAVATLGGVDQLLISGFNSVTSYDPATGKQLWKTSCTAVNTCGTVVTRDDHIFASGGFPQTETVCLSASGEKIWSNQDKLYETSPIVSGDYLVGVADDGIAICWDRKSGERVWRKRLGGNFSASPILVGDAIYVSNLEGQTFVFRAGEDFEMLAENRLGDNIYASPAVSKGRLFLRIGIGVGSERREQLVCIGDPESSTWQSVHAGPSQLAELARK